MNSRHDQSTDQFKSIKYGSDEYWYRRGEYKCICGHWGFSHEYPGIILGTSIGRFCHNCTCSKLKRDKQKVKNVD